MCVEGHHRFIPISSPYYKVTGEKRRFGLGMKKDRSVTYLMLLCESCGETLEITLKDKRYSLDQVNI